MAWKQHLTLDRFEQVVVSIMFSIFAYRMANNLITIGSPAGFIYLFDQLIVLAFILARRRSDQITKRSWEWFAAFAGTLLPLLVVPVEGVPLAPSVISGSLMLVGMVIHLTAKFTLRRSMGVVAANRGVKVSGPYRIVRHPMYAGYVIVLAGMLLNWPSLQNFVVMFLCWGIVILRIISEERVLASDPLYRDLKATTRFRLIPGIY